jgi:hypothetical protein
MGRRENLRLGPERPVQRGEVWASKILSLDGEYLVGDADRPLRTAAGIGVLEGFLRLATATPDEVFRFARRWGALGIERKAVPGLRFHEPVAVWRELAIRFRALQRIGAAVNGNSLGDEDDWRALSLPVPVARGRYSAIEEARFALMSRIGRLVREAGLYPRLYWNNVTTQWQIELSTYTGTNLLAVLVLNLMVLIADKDGYAICCACRKSYIPERQPSARRRNYCPECRTRGVPYRDSKRVQRRRNNEKQSKTKSRDQRRGSI